MNIFKIINLIYRAFEQHEVTCSPNLRDTNSFWNIEDNINPMRKLNIHDQFLNVLSILINEKENYNTMFKYHNKMIIF